MIVGATKNIQVDTVIAQVFSVGHGWSENSSIWNDTTAIENYTPKWINFFAGREIGGGEVQAPLLVNITTVDPATGKPQYANVIGQGNLTKFNSTAEVDWNNLARIDWCQELVYGTSYAIVVNSQGTGGAGRWWEWGTNNTDPQPAPDGKCWRATNIGDPPLGWIDEQRAAGYEIYTWIPDTTTPNVTALRQDPFGITTTNATVFGYLRDDANAIGQLKNFSANFIVSEDSPPTTSNELFNISASIGHVTNWTHPKFEANIPGLLPGHYYYVKAQLNDSAGDYNTSYDSATFLTKPTEPTALSSSRNGVTATLTWNLGNFNTSNNYSTIVLFNKNAPAPTSITDGTIIYNSTGTSYNHILTSPGVYNYSAFSYINASGSPFYWWTSDVYDTTSITADGSIFNVSVFWSCNFTLMDATPAFQNSILYGLTKEGEIIYENSSLTSNPILNITTFAIPDMWVIDWNQTGYLLSYIPTPGQRNISFYVMCLDACEPGNLSIYCAPRYTFSFIDETPNFRFLASNEAQLHIYTYNGSEKITIQKAYFSADDTVKVTLEMFHRYYVGVSIPGLDIPFLQYIDTDENTNIEIRIHYEEDATLNINDYITVNTSWAGNSFYTNYTEPSNLTQSINFSIYQIYKTNSTRDFVNGTTYTNATIINGYISNHFTLAEGCDQNASYLIILTIQHGLFSTNQTITARLFSWNESKTINDTSWLNSIIVDVLGPSPFAPVQYTDTIAFFLCIILLFSFAYNHAEIALFISGLALAASELVFGLASAISISAVAGGIIMMMLAILFIYGGRQR